MKVQRSYRFNRRSDRIVEDLHNKYNVSRTEIIEQAIALFGALDATPIGLDVTTEQLKNIWMFHNDAD